MRYVLMLVVSTLLLAANTVAEESSVEPPPIDQGMEPEVVITPKEQGRVKEYRINGQLYMIEIIPEKGAPYFLVDTDGDGLLETRQNQIQPDILIPSWPILRW